MRASLHPPQPWEIEVPAARRRPAKLTDGPNGIVAGGHTLRSVLDRRLRNKRLTPGQRRLAQCRCHTHLVYGGDRAHEFAQRLADVSHAETERRQLRAARRLGRERGVTVSTNFLGAHVVPAKLAYRFGFNPLHARVWRGR